MLKKKTAIPARNGVQKPPDRRINLAQVGKQPRGPPASCPCLFNPLDPHVFVHIHLGGGQGCEGRHIVS